MENNKFKNKFKNDKKFKLKTISIKSPTAEEKIDDTNNDL